MRDTRYDDHNFIPPIENGEDMFKYRTLVKSLLTLAKEFTQDDFEFMSAEDRTYKFGYSNHQLHYFFFSIDWKYLYFSNLRTGKLTLYDIFANTPTKDKKKKVEELQTSYLCLKALFDGDFETKISAKNFSFKEMRETILKTISLGLQGYGLDKGSRKKGIHELFRHIFTELANVDYEFEDFKKPYLDKSLRRSKVHITVFDRFAIVNIFNELYKKQFGLRVRRMFLSESAISHILLRHTVPCKIYTNKLPNQKHQSKIKNGLGEYLPITALRLDETKEYPIGVIGDDGVFYLPNFSTKQDSYFQFLCDGGKITQQIIEQSITILYELLCKIVEVLEIKYDSTKSPNIVYNQGIFYGIEVNKHQGNTIESFYPLNSDFQEKNGILKKDFDRIINKDDRGNHLASYYG